MSAPLEYKNRWWPGLSTRALNVLYLNDIQSKTQLSGTSERTVRKFRNCGCKTINELRFFLQKEGLDLADLVESRILRLEAEVRRLKELIRQKDIFIAHSVKSKGVDALP